MNSFLSLLKSNKKNKESNYKKKSYDHRKTLARHRRYCGRGHKVSICGKYYIQFILLLSLENMEVELLNVDN